MSTRKTILTLTLAILLTLSLIPLSSAYVYQQGINEKAYEKYDYTGNRAFGYNYKNANKVSEKYEDQFSINSYQNYFSKFSKQREQSLTYTKSKTIKFNPSIHKHTNMWRN